MPAALPLLTGALLWALLLWSLPAPASAAASSSDDLAAC
jgi:hypothetical protein